MGNRSSSRHQGSLCPSETELTNFQLIKLIGSGTFGKVFIVYHKGMKKEYALKAMNKRKIVRKKLAENVIRELELLKGVSHPFICSLWYAFQDEEHIFQISDLLTGGDLQYHLKNQGRFSESRSKLLICELALALDYLHGQKIGHFDVKPANILLDDQGHAHLTDFGLARKLGNSELVKSFSGTRLYMAPEILLTALGSLPGYDWSVDWWSLGICFYELLRGRTPYEYPASLSSLQVLTIIYTRSVTMPSRWPSDLISFIRNLISPEFDLRIGSFKKFLSHPYVSRIKWRDVFERKMVPFFVPQMSRHHHHEHRHGFRATIAVPIHSHRLSRNQGHILRNLRPRDHSTDGSSGKSNQSRESTQIDEEIMQISARFKNYNRFKCEVRIAEPRLSLAPIMERERKIESGRSPINIENSSTATREAGMVTSRAEKMRKLFQASNRDMNYSM